jgi:N-methylhydantoinase A/oxoprolinase/acetone carboxylase beta subunit
VLKITARLVVEMGIRCDELDVSPSGFTCASAPRRGKARLVRPALAIGSMVVLAPCVMGCGTADDRADAQAATERFYAAVANDDGAAACEELSEDTVKELESQSGQRCAGAVTDLEYAGGSVVMVEVYATNAKADLSGGESVFLSPESGSWKLSAIACTPEEGKPRDRPLDCEAQA